MIRAAYIVIALATLFFPASAQVRIASGTGVVAATGTGVSSAVGINNLSAKADFSHIDLTMDASSGTALASTSPLTLHGLKVKGGGSVTLSGSWTLTDSLILTSGKILVSSTGSQLVYQGQTDLSGSDAAWVTGPLYRKGSGTITFPIGNSDGYFPVRIESTEEVEIAFECAKGDPGFDFSALAGVVDMLRTRYWDMTLKGTTFTGAPIAISSNLLADFLLSGNAGEATILESTADRTVTSLGGSTVGEFVSAKEPASATGKRYAIGKVEGVPIKIGEVLTPNGDGLNNVLRIANIELFPTNNVTLLDRYGVPVHTWKNFKNYTTTDAKQDFDFTSLAIGNYIVIVEYTDLRIGSQKATQMITVLK